MTYAQRLKDIALRLEGLSEDAATDADEGNLDFAVFEALNEAEDAIERALKLVASND